MSDDYLWDGAGKPDPEIQKLETVLGSLRHNHAAPAFPEIAPRQPQPARSWFWRTRMFPRFAFAAAAGVLVMAVIAFLMYRSKTNYVGSAGWEVTRVSGMPRIGLKTLSAQNAQSKLGLGQTLETDGQSRATISVEEVGEIE